MELSKRLQAVAGLVSTGMVVADVGTDHGYIPIYLLKEGRIPKAVAMDINEGPLLRAKQHIQEYGLTKQIETRLSDGVNALEPGECECVIIAGMGGALTIKILMEGREVFRTLQEFVLQPQSELSKVRKFLCENDYTIIAEDMVLEEGKFYPMMKVKNGQSEEQTKVELRYGKQLLSRKNAVLKQFLQKEQQVKTKILVNLQEESGSHIEIRKKELEEELEDIAYALQTYY